jgi:hypothetical protein
MSRRSLATLTLVAAAVLAPAAVRAQGPPDPEALLSAQRTAMAPLARLDGVWRGPAWTILPNGQRVEVTQTERVGSFLDGSVKVIEGRAYDAEGKVVFNAFAVISYNPGRQTYSLRSWAQGQSGDFVLTPNADGYVWEIPFGSMTIRYTAVIRDGTWHEVGERIMQGQAPVRFTELTLRRVGDTDWPGAGAVPRQ